MNKDFRINVGLFTHPKTIKLQRRLGADGVLAFLRILAYTATNRPSGVLDGVDMETLGIAADYEDIKALVDALVDIGFLDRRGKRLSVHDWAKHNGYAMHAEARSERAREAANARWAKENEPCGEHATGMQQAQSSNAPSPSPTPNPKPDPNTEPGPEHPVPTSKKRTRRQKITIQDYFDQCEAEGVLPVPADDPIFVYAEQAKIPHEFLKLCWDEFWERHQETGKKYADWRATFRNCVRANWYKLWWSPTPGEYQLTTAGMQAKKKQEAA